MNVTAISLAKTNAPLNFMSGTKPKMKKDEKDTVTIPRSKFLQLSKDAALGAMLAANMLVGASSIQSCSKDSGIAPVTPIVIPTEVKQSQLESGMIDFLINVLHVPTTVADGVTKSNGIVESLKYNSVESTGKHHYEATLNRELSSKDNMVYDLVLDNAYYVRDSFKQSGSEILQKRQGTQKEEKPTANSVWVDMPGGMTYSKSSDGKKIDEYITIDLESGHSEGTLEYSSTGDGSSINAYDKANGDVVMKITDAAVHLGKNLDK